jgi:ABC-2 type transport system permease protein
VRGVWIIYRRELSGLFMRPLAWVLLFIALVYFGSVFSFLILPALGGDVTVSLQYALGGSRPYWWLMILLPPMITMRMVSEEARAGLLEYLLTAPVRDSAVVIGKLAAATTFMIVLFSAVLIYALALEWIGTVPTGGVDWGPVAVGFLGTALVSAFFCSVGLAVSAATDTPLVAGFLAFVVNLFLVYVLPLLGRTGNFGPDHWLTQTLTHLDVQAQLFGSFTIGVLDTRSLAFFAAWTAFFAFLATRLVEMRRWR